MSETQCPAAGPIRPTNSRAATAALILALLGAGAAALLWQPRETCPLPIPLLEDLHDPLDPVVPPCAAFAARLTGLDVQQEGGQLTIRDSDGHLFILSVAYEDRLLGLPHVLLFLLAGAVVVACTWPMGPIRKTLIFLTIPLAPPLSMALLGVLMGLLSAGMYDCPDLFVQTKPLVPIVALHLSVLLLGGLWCLIRAVASDDDDAEPVPAAALTARPSPLLWPLAGAIAVAVVPWMSAALGIGLGVFGKGIAGLPPLLWALPGPLGAAVLFTLTLLGARWPARLLWLPCLFLGAGPGSLAFLLALLLRNDEATEFLHDDLLPPAAAQRLRNRLDRRLPLLALLLAALGWLGILSLILTAAGLLPSPLSDLVAATPGRAVLLALSACGLALTLWHILPLRPASPRPYTRLAVVSGVLAVLALPACLLAGRFLPPPLADRSVPWPACVQVDPETFRLTSLPTTIGPYRMAEPGDFGQENREHPGENIYPPATMDILGIGGGIDKPRLPLRRSNWYISRLYIDTRTFGRGFGHGSEPPSLWWLDVNSYTGSLPVRPHAPETTFVSVGRRILTADDVRFTLSVSSDQSRRQADPIAFRRVVAEDTRTGYSSVDYYTFIINGRAEPSRDVARRAVADPRRRFAFAKIQFRPMGIKAADLSAADRAAGEFVQAFMPEVLRCLPPADDVRP